LVGHGCDPTQITFLVKFGHIRGAKQRRYGNGKRDTEVWEWENREEVTVVGPTCQTIHIHVNENGSREGMGMGNAAQRCGNGKQKREEATVVGPTCQTIHGNGNGRTRNEAAYPLES
jgi:hypothetical protein